MQSNIESLLSNCISPDNAVRDQAEKEIEILSTQNTAEFTGSILDLIQAKANYVEIGAMILQKKVINISKSFKNLNGDQIGLIAEVFTKLIDPKLSLSSLKRVSEILIALYRMKDATLEFFRLVEPYTLSDNNNIKLFIIYSLETFAEYTYEDELLGENSHIFTNLFKKYMEDPDSEVKISAACSFTNFLAFINNEKYILGYKDVFPILLQLLIESVKEDQDRGIKMVDSINGLVKSHPKFIKESVEGLLDVYTEMVGTPQVANSLRNAALIGIFTLATKNSAQIKKSKIFVDKTLPVLIRVAAEQPDEIDGWLVVEDKHDLSSNLVSSNAVENFARLNEALGAKFMLQKTIGLAFEAIKSDDWKFKYAGLM